MPEKKKEYNQVIFSQAIIKDVIKYFKSSFKNYDTQNEQNRFVISTSTEEWGYAQQKKNSLLNIMKISIVCPF